jgi:hypothetical protein
MYVSNNMMGIPTENHDKKSNKVCFQIVMLRFQFSPLFPVQLWQGMSTAFRSTQNSQYMQGCSAVLVKIKNIITRERNRISFRTFSNSTFCILLHVFSLVFCSLAIACEWCQNKAASMRNSLNVFYGFQRVILSLFLQHTFKDHPIHLSHYIYTYFISHHCLVDCSLSTFSCNKELA